MFDKYYIDLNFKSRDKLLICTHLNILRRFVFKHLVSCKTIINKMLVGVYIYIIINFENL